MLCTARALELGLPNFFLPNAIVRLNSRSLYVENSIQLRPKPSAGFRVVDRLIQSAHDHQRQPRTTSTSPSLQIYFLSYVKSAHLSKRAESRARTAHILRICAITKRCDVCTHIP
jgi:hypothetical protein